MAYSDPTYTDDPNLLRYAKLPNWGNVQASQFLGAPPPGGMAVPDYGVSPNVYTDASATTPTASAPAATTPTNALAGWDQTKWADPTHQTTKYAVGRILAGYPATVAGLQQAWPEIQKQFPGATFNGKDTITGLPGTLGPVDVLAGASQGGTGWWWGDQGGQAAGSGAGAVGLTPANRYTPSSLPLASGSFGGSGTSRSIMGVANPNTGRANALYDFLMQRATQGLNVNANDPLIRNQVDAYSAQQQRARRDYLSDVAERAGSTANIGAETRSSAEKVGQSTGAFEATLMGQELSARRQEIQAALNGAMGFLTQQQQLQLQEELAQLELAQREYQFGERQGLEESQFGRTLAQRAIEEGNMDAWRNSPLYG